MGACWATNQMAADPLNLWGPGNLESPKSKVKYVKRECALFPPILVSCLLSPLVSNTILQILHDSAFLGFSR